ncbi:MAG TPA: choice-of-anchor D domain-containing protein [Candidatus Sumerlaeota bacterium]|nr:choice-of-anchor D domain-containing protein [Candidatus Sumerlaeota bacterium]
MKKIYVLMLVVMLACSLGYAKKFSDAPAGQGASTVGVSGDYATLAEAANDFNGLAGGCTGDWTLTVISDLTEPDNVGFGNSTNGYTVTLKSDESEMRTITFTATAVHATYRGHLVIGVNDLNGTPIIQKTDKFVIDGGASKQLTLTNTSASIAYSAIIIYYGDCDNGQVKNCVIANLSTNAGANSCTGIDFIAAGTFLIPNDYRVEGCVISALTGNVASGIQASGTATAGLAQTGAVITGNTIAAKRYGIFLALNAGGEISNNEIKIQDGTASALCLGIYHSNCNSLFGWTMDIVNNKFTEMTSLNNAAGDYGLIGMWLGASATVAAPVRPVYNVCNNMIANFSFPGNNAVRDETYKGINLVAEYTDFNIFNNSIDMVEQPRLTAGTRGRTFAIGATSVTAGSQIKNIKNNIIRYGVADGANAYALYSPIATGINSDFNNIYIYSATNQFAYVGTTSCADLSAWQTQTATVGAMQDVHTSVIDPSTFWVSGSDLHIAGAASYNVALSAPVLAGVATDIDGEARFGKTYKGCDEKAASDAGPTLYMPDTTVNFGIVLPVALGGSAVQMNVQVWNISTSALNISGVTPGAGSADFTVISFPPSIAANESGNIVIQYTPNTLGAQSQTFSIASNDSASPTILTVNGTAGTKKFSDAPSGQGMSTVGVGGDYASLAEAADDFNGVAGGCTGDWTLSVISDLTEPANAGFSNFTNGYTVKLQSDGIAMRTITFTATSVDATYPGHLVIGAKLVAPLSRTGTDRFVIDGGASKLLTIQNTSAAIANSAIISIQGNSDYSQIKNTIITNLSTNTANYGCTGIEYFTAGTTLVPDFSRIEGCTITTLGGPAQGTVATGIQSRGTATGGLAHSGYVITNNVIISKRYGIWLAMSAGGEISDNEIRIRNGHAGVVSNALYHSGCNNAFGWTMDIVRNQFVELHTLNVTANQGIGAIWLTATTPSQRSIYNISNNMICGWNYGAGSTMNQVYRGIQCQAENAQYNIHHNSIDMPVQPRVNGATIGYAYAIGTTSSAFGSQNLSIKNNMIRFGTFTGTNAYALYIVHPSGLTSDFNDIYFYNGTTKFGYLGAACGTLAAWQARSALFGPAQDMHTKVIDPSPDWVSLTDLHINGSAVFNTAFCGPIIDVGADIDGNPRDTVTYMGCDEFASIAAGPTVYLPDPTYDFGKKLLIGSGGVPVLRSVQVWNVSAAPLNISSVTPVASNPDIIIHSHTMTPIQPNQSGDIVIQYTPNNAGAQTATFNINSDDPASPMLLTITGTGNTTKRFSDPPVGQGTSTVGSAADDYVTLMDAAQDFNNTAGGCTGNWDLLVNATWTEPYNVGFANATNGFTVTMKPNTGFTPTITLDQRSVIAAFPGHLVIGANNFGDANNAVKTDNFIIDGDNGGALSQDMTIQNMNANFAARLIVVHGDSDGVVIKNNILTNRSISTAVNGCTGVVFQSRNHTINGVIYNLLPDNWIVDNNTITTNITAGSYGLGIEMNNSGTITAGNAQSGWTISNNIINARQRGIFMNQTAGGTISNNTISIGAVLAGLTGHGIFHNTCNNTPGWTMNIFNNKITSMSHAGPTANYGLVAIEVSGSAVTGAYPTYNVYNNMVSGYQFTSATDGLYRGIYCGTKNCNLNVFYNSINMPSSPLVITTPGYGCAIGIKEATAFSVYADIRNNNIRIAEDRMWGIWREDVTALTSNFNNIFIDGTTVGTNFGRLGGENFGTLAEWQVGTGKDINSSSIDPTAAIAPYTGAWTSNTDLHFTAWPGPYFAAQPITGIAEDGDGDPRSASAPTMGCDESQGTPAPGDQKCFVPGGMLYFGKKLRLNHGGVAVTDQLVVLNAGYQGTLNITAVNFVSGSNELTVTDTFPISIPPNSYGAINFKYDPWTFGLNTAIFDIVSDDPASPTPVNISGRGSNSKKFSEIPVGRYPSKIGTSVDDDYPSLEIAVDDFNNTPGGCTGDWTLLINTSPLDVNNLIAFGNATNGYTVTMKPNDGMLPSYYPVVITSNVTAMSSIPGHFIIGTNDYRNLANLVKVDNFIIDGSPDGTPTRQIVFQNKVAAIANSRIFLVYGDCDNVQIKNCTIINNSTNTRDNGCTGIEFMSRNIAAGVNAIPDNGLVENCDITAQGTGAVYGYGIRQTASGTITAANAQTGMVFRNNNIAARYMGIWMAQTAGAIVEGNNIALVNTGGLSIKGIYFSACNALFNWTLQINNNKITQLQNATGGMTGIDLGLNSANGNATFNVYNNMISGFAFTGSVSNKEYRGIYHASRNNENHIVNIYHNSINMPNLAGLTITDNATGYPLCAGIQFHADTSSFQFSRAINVKNNIVRVEQNRGCALYLREYLTSLTDQDYNDCFVAGGAVFGRYQEGASTIINYNTLDDWRAVHTSLDKNTSTLDPAISNGIAPFDGKWTSATDLLFDAYPAGGFAGTPIAGITTDINGVARNAFAPVMGCDEKKISGAKFFARDYGFGYKEIIRPGGKGTVVTKDLEIYNLGDSALTVTDISRGSGSDEISILNFTTTPIPAGGSGTMTVEYNPETIGAKVATFNPVSNDVYSTPTFTITGEAVYPQIEITCSQGSDWGNVFIGEPTVNKSLSIKNVGKVPLVISDITASGHPDIVPVSLPPLPFTLYPAPEGNNTTYAVYKYTPMTAGPVSKLVSINSDAEVSAGYYTFTGRGIGISLEENPVFIGFAKVQGLDGATTITKDLVIVNETNFETTYTITRVSGTKFRAPSTVYVDVFSTAPVPIEYAATAVVNDVAIFNMAASHPQMPALTAIVNGRGWTKTQGKLYMVNGNDGGTFQVDNGGTYTLTRIEIQPGSFTGVRELRIQEPTNLYGKDNAIELKIDPSTVLGNYATLWVEYHPSDVPPAEQNINMGVMRYWGSWSVLPGTVGTFVDRGDGKFEVRYDAFNNLLTPFVYATGTYRTEVDDWKIFK